LLAANDASMQFSVVLPMGGFAFASSSQPIPCSNRNCISNNITNMSSIENMRLVDGWMNVDGAMSLGG